MKNFTYWLQPSTQAVIDAYMATSRIIEGTDDERNVIGDLNQWTNSQALTAAFDQWTQVADISFSSSENYDISFSVTGTLGFRILDGNVPIDLDNPTYSVIEDDGVVPQRC